ncbi:ABC transporter substrate-binding protein [Paenibacillus roseipurpureus]|uniref:Extracellular solute-binding protein n=1 Tax=Paenibacillus roseopurpureus TaxID=2918901 RepID=A0AA96RLR2_9BACL|nr:extracellular solute-binding protein [Paenibacillus sp. MBLB1832]WNR45681.1 extracellular solute-binding protein [Paenibacillus sp. MBLB1832]
MNKKWIKGMPALMLATAMLLSACGKDSTSGTSTASPSTNAKESAKPAQKQVELRVINWRVEDKAFFDDMHAKFEKEYPNIKIKYDTVPSKDYIQLRQARMAVGEVDVVSELYNRVLLTPELRDQWVDLSNQKFLQGFNKGMLDIHSADGKVLGLPWNAAGLVVFYNKKIFADNGLKEPTTWSEFKGEIEKLKGAKITPFMEGGLDAWPVQQIVHGLEPAIVRGTNPDFYGKNNENIKSEKSKFSDASWQEVFDKFSYLASNFQPNSAGQAYSQAPALFAQGKSAMTIDGTWSLQQMQQANPQLEIGSFFLPATDNVEQNKVQYVKAGGAYFIPKNSPNQEAALKYLEFFARNDVYQKYIDDLKFLPIKDGIKVSDPAASDIAAKMAKLKGASSFTELVSAGMKYDLNVLSKVSIGELKAADAGKEFQKILLETKPNWK